MNSKTIEVSIGQAVPNLTGTAATAAIAAWREAQQLLQQCPFSVEDPFSEQQDGYSLSMDVSSVIAVLDKAAKTDGGFPKFRQQLREKPQADAVATIRITLAAKGTPHGELAYYHASAVALQQLYLCLNIAAPGSCQFVDTRFPDVATASFDPLNLESAPFVDGYLNSVDAEWPVIKPLAVATVWNWLDAMNTSETDTAILSTNKVLFGLLELGYSQSGLKNKNIVLICHLLELLTETTLADSLNQVRSRLKLMLGSRSQEGDSLHELYRLKQNYISGARPYRRQALKIHDTQEESIRQLATHNSPAEEGLAIIIAVLQKLVQANASGFKFEEQLTLATMG